MEIVACRQEIQECKEKAEEAERMEERFDRIGKELQEDWVDAEVTLQVTENDIDAANAIIPSLEQMSPIEEVKEELMEWLLQGGARTVERGLYLNRKLMHLLQTEAGRPLDSVYGGFLRIRRNK